MNKIMKKQIFFALLIFLATIKHNTNIYGKYMNYNIKNNKNIYFVILAGGNGTRLWPLSKPNKPKQFIKVGTDKTLLDQAIDRVKSLVPKENIWIGTTKNHVKNIKKYVGEKIGNIVIEPGMRNTAPAILLSCLEIYKQNKDAIIIFLPVLLLIVDLFSYDSM